MEKVKTAGDDYDDLHALTRLDTQEKSSHHMTHSITKNWFLFLIVLHWCVCATVRVDFFKENGSFRLTLGAITSVLILTLFPVTKKIKTERNVLKEYCFLLYTFLSLVLVSCFLSVDANLSLKRVILLFLYATAAYESFIYFIKNKIPFEPYLYFAICVESILYAIYTALDYLIWKSIISADLINLVLPYYNTALEHLGAFMIRTRGGAQDSNIGGSFIIFFTLILLYVGKKEQKTITYAMIILNLLCLILTLSRTAIISFVLMSFLYLFFSLKRNKSGIAFFIIVFVFLFYCLSTLSIFTDAFNSIVERFTNKDDASRNNHISIIYQGFDIAFSDIKIFFVGNGYGASGLLLKNMFDNKYANFHNAFITFLVESGFPSMIMFLILLARNILKNTMSMIFCAVFIIVNFSYQVFTEPFFWVSLSFIYAINVFAETNTEYNQ